MCQETRKAFPCHPKQRVSQSLGTIPGTHGGGSALLPRAGTGWDRESVPLSPPALLPTAWLPVRAGPVCSAGVWRLQGLLPSTFRQPWAGCRTRGHGDVFEENTSLKVPRLSLARGCCLCSATHVEQENTGISDFTGSSCSRGFIRNWAEVTNAAEPVPFASQVTSGALAELLNTTWPRIPSVQPSQQQVFHYPTPHQHPELFWSHPCLCCPLGWKSCVLTVFQTLLSLPQLCFPTPFPTLCSTKARGKA